MPLASVTPCSGMRTSSACDREKVTGTPPTGVPNASVTRNVRVDCSGEPDPRT